MKKQLKVHVYLLCFNEEAIIESVIRYYSSFCSKIFIMDNMSTDNSVAIANKFSNVTIVPWESDGIDESLYIHMKSQTYKKYSRQGGIHTSEVADWVISCDMDEILYHHNILEALDLYDKKGVTVPQITGFNIAGENEVDCKKPIVEQYSLAQRAEGFDKRIIFKPEFNITYHEGCHPRGSGFDCMKNTYGYKTSNEYPLALLHYKHIGSRLYVSAKKNYNRMFDNADKIVGRGKESAVGKYYNNIVQKEVLISPLVRQAIKVFDDEGRVRFNDFNATTGEEGVDLLIENNKFINQEDVNFVRDLAIGIEKTDLNTALKLMKIALKFRPDGEGMKMKINEYQDRLSKGNVN
ncbi:glycosyltransferase family 2 protein [Pseudoalteromonas agarivorans]|uniref:glycosyltransferase family 2 protein n=1 Tax=Pseudoalteromonas agarivorans TaxID=176102 RepID=UPI002117FA24|nr:glycosyltransferase family 2 protein [Pseudoalteromonas agarivorans]MCQ8887696.1 glycosyltransferase family 2 protein [Pseudoalteromonas agarivorans]